MKDAALTDANMKMVIGEVAKRYEAAKVSNRKTSAPLSRPRRKVKSAAAMMKKQSAGAKKKESCGSQG